MDEIIQEIRNLIARCKFTAAYDLGDKYGLEPILVGGKIQIVEKTPVDMYSSDDYKIGGTAW